MARSNWLDDVISFMSPQAGAARARSRFIEETFRSQKRKFEGAGAGRRFDGWITTSASANAENWPALVRLRNRSRDLSRNNPWGCRAVNVVSSNTVGTGIIGRVKGESKRRVSLVGGVWSEWAESLDCDFDGLHDLYGLQRLAMRTIAESGEVLIRRHWAPKGYGGAVRMQLQVLEPDFIDTNRTQSLDNSSGGQIVQGIEYDKDGRRVAYWLFDQHPGELLLSLRSNNYRSQRVPASEIRHVFDVLRPGQVRGIPQCTPVIVKLKDFDDYEDAQLLRQKIAACFTAFIHDMEGPETPAKAAATIGEKLEPGAIEILPDGKEITFANPPGVQGYGEYSRSVLHAIAAGYGITYEALTGDYSNVNFSSARMGFLEFKRNLDQWQYLMMIPRLCAPIWGWFREGATIAGIQTGDVRMAWTPPRREQIDPVSEGSAQIASIRAGTKSLSQSILEGGDDPDEVLAQIKADNDKIDGLGLILDSDPRKTMKAGLAQSYITDEDGHSGKKSAGAGNGGKGE